MNEAALFAARENLKFVGMEQLDKAKDKIMMGAERKSMVMDEDEKKLTAYHEAGHAIVGLCVPEHDPVYKVTIIPRGRALGVTMFLPEQDRYSHSRRRLYSQLCSLYGGRIAEELIFGADAVTTGASNDIERATDIARKMVKQWGLSELGPLNFGEEEGEVFLGRSSGQGKEVSEKTSEQIDIEVKRILTECYQQAENILKDNNDKLHLMAKALVKYETIDAVQIKQIMAGEEPEPPSSWTDTQDSSQASGGKSGQDTDSKQQEDDKGSKQVIGDLDLNNES